MITVNRHDKGNFDGLCWYWWQWRLSNSDSSEENRHGPVSTTQLISSGTWFIALRVINPNKKIILIIITDIYEPSLLIRRIVTTKALLAPLYSGKCKPRLGTHPDTVTWSIYQPPSPYKSSQNSVLIIIPKASNRISSP